MSGETVTKAVGVVVATTAVGMAVATAARVATAAST